MNIGQETNFYRCDSTTTETATPMHTLLCMNAECSDTNSSPFLLSDSFQYPMNVRIVSPKIYSERPEQNERKMVEIPTNDPLANQPTNIFSSPVLIHHNCSRNNSANGVNENNKNGTACTNDQINTKIHTMV